MTTLASLWEFSLLLCSAALLALAILLFARVIAANRGDRREKLRKALLPAMLSGEAIDLGGSQLAKSVAANLTLELAELVRGNDRLKLIAGATAAGADEILMKRLRSHAPQDRLIAAEALAMFPEHTDAITQVALDDPNPDVRLGASLALAQEGRAPPPAQLVRALGVGSTEQSLLATSLLRDLARTDPRGVEALLYEADLPDAAKLAATDALAETGAVEHAPLVAWMASAAGDESELQPRIFRALGRLGHPGGHSTIISGLDSRIWQVRSSAAEAAGRAGLRTATSRLTELLDDEQWWVRFRAGEALARLGNEGRLALHQATLSASPVARDAAKITLRERGLA